jgi:hypothetical protein
MDRRDEWRETESCTFFDASSASDNEWNIDTAPRTDGPESDASPARQTRRIMVVGFGVIRV